MVHEQSGAPITISIVTPSFNKASFLGRTIESVLSQEGNFRLEYIIVDGGSTDGSIELIKQYAQRDARIIWWSERDSGQSAAINKGLRQASGDILAYVNADDVYTEGALQHVVDWFQHHPAALWAYGFCTIMNENDKEILRPITWYKNMWLRHFSLATLLILNYISQPACFWRKQALLDVGYFSEKHDLVMDYEYWLRLAQHSSAGVMPHTLARFRRYQTSKSGKRYREQFRHEYATASQFAHHRPMIRALHWLHNQLIFAVYSFLH